MKHDPTHAATINNLIAERDRVAQAAAALQQEKNRLVFWLSAALDAYAVTADLAAIAAEIDAIVDRDGTVTETVDALLALGNRLRATASGAADARPVVITTPDVRRVTRDPAFYFRHLGDGERRTLTLQRVPFPAAEAPTNGASDPRDAEPEKKPRSRLIITPDGATDL